MKTDDYVEGRAGPKKILSMQRTATPKVATKQKPTIKWMEFGLTAKKTDENAEGHTMQKKSPNTPWTGYSLKAAKTDGYYEDRAKHVLASNR